MRYVDENAGSGAVLPPGVYTLQVLFFIFLMKFQSIVFYALLDVVLDCLNKFASMN